MDLEIKSILTVVVNFLVGAAVAHGVVDQGSSDAVVNQVTSIVGNGIILATAIYSLHNYVHKATGSAEIAPKTAPSVQNADTVVITPPVAQTVAQTPAV